MAFNFSDRAIQLIAEARIEAAVDAGEFDKIEGMGEPFKFDERKMNSWWWIRRKVDQEKLRELTRSFDHPTFVETDKRDR